MDAESPPGVPWCPFLFKESDPEQRACLREWCAWYSEGMGECSIKVTGDYSLEQLPDGR